MGLIIQKEFFQEFYKNQEFGLTLRPRKASYKNISIIKIMKLCIKKKKKIPEGLIF